LIATKRSVLHLTPLAEIGGCEVNCLRIIEAGAECEHNVLVFGVRGPMSAAWERAGARVQHLGAWQRGSSRFATALAGWGQAQPPPDAVMYWSTSRLPAVLRALCRWSAPWAVYLGNPLSPGIIPSFRRRLHEWIHPAYPAVTLVACSHHVAASHREAGYFRRFATRVIHNAVDPALDQMHHYRPLPPGSAPRIGMVARLDRIKDHRTLIRACAAAVAVRPDIVVEIAGDGPLRQDLEQEALRLRVGERVRFLGFRPVGPLLSEWDIYVHSTTESEGMGTAVAEAMMAGLPCLVSDLPVMREVCGQEGATYAPAGDAAGLGDALLQLVGDRSRRESMGRAAQSRARQMFGMSEAASAYSKVVFPGPGKGSP